MNPELQRNLWLEASPRRLAWAGVVCLVIYISAVVIADETGPGGVVAALGSAGALVFFATALVWGVRLAGQSVSSEIGERTWEFQRLSALDPWTMTWGKLLGATSLAWAAGLTGLLPAALAYADAQGAAATLTFVLASVALGVLLQAAGFAAALVGVRKARAEGRLATLRSAAGGVFSVIFLLGAITVVGRIAGVFVADGFGFTPTGEGATVPFWGAEVDRRLFTALSLTAFAGWALVAGWRLMRLELQKRNSPLLWVAFLVFTAFWAAGQVSPDFAADADSLGAESAVRWGLAALVFTLGVYAAAFAEPADRMRLRRFVDGVRGRGAAWITHAPGVAPALLLSAIAFAGLIAEMLGATAFDVEDDITRGESVLFLLAIFAFVLRDVAVVGFFRFGPRPKRGDFGAVLALVLLYGLGGLVAASLGGDAVSIILPSFEQPAVSLVAGLVQAAAAGVLAFRRIVGPERSNVPA